MSARRELLDFQYTVDGERVTMAQIKARFPNIHPTVLQRRVYRGLRTWAQLGECTKIANARNKVQLKNKFFSHDTPPVLEAMMDNEDYIHGEEFEAQLDAIAPDRHRNEIIRDLQMDLRDTYQSGDY